MIPDKVKHFSTLPKNQNGKIDRIHLKDYSPNLMPSKKLIIFGTGIISQCVTPYFERSDCKGHIYCCDALFWKSSFNDRPVIDIDHLLTSFSSDD